MSNMCENTVRIEQICANIKNSPHELDFNGMKILVKPYLNRSDSIEFIYNISMYLLKRYADTDSMVWVDRIIRTFTILAYTNIDIAKYVTDIDEFDDEEDILILLAYETPIYAQLVGTVQHPQYFRGVAYTDSPINIEQYDSLIDAVYTTLNKWLTISVNQYREGEGSVNEKT